MAEEEKLGLSPHLVVDGGKAAIAFYQKAFGAVEITCSLAPDSDKVMHAALLIADSVVMLSDDFQEFMGGRSRNPTALGGSPVTLHLQVEDAEAAWARAVEAGATPTMPLMDQFWGARYGQLRDPFGQQWSIGQTLRQVSPEEAETAAREAFGRTEAHAGRESS